MTRQQGDLCPHCNKGKLSVHPDTMITDGASYRTWLCDECGKTCKDHVIELIENVDVSDDVDAKNLNHNQPRTQQYRNTQSLSNI